jgi:hypothetical protein
MRELRRQPTGETVLTRWVGHLVVLKYLAGPAAPADPDDPRNLAEAEPEARSGIFHFQRFGQLGIEVSNEMGEGLLNRVTFIPWGAVLSIRGTTEEQERESSIRREQAHPRAGSPARPARQRMRLATNHKATQGTPSQLLMHPTA